MADSAALARSTRGRRRTAGRGAGSVADQIGGGATTASKCVFSTLKSLPDALTGTWRWHRHRGVRGQRAEDLRRFHGDSPTEACAGAGVSLLPPSASALRLAASRDRTAFRRCSPAIDKPAAGGSRRECLPRQAPPAPRQSRCSCRSTSRRVPQLGEPSAPALARCRYLGCQRRSRPIIECAVQVPAHFQRRLLRRFGDEPRHLPAIAHENDLLLLMLNAIQHCAEVACDLGDGERFHG